MGPACGSAAVHDVLPPYMTRTGVGSVIVPISNTQLVPLRKPSIENSFCHQYRLGVPGMSSTR
jgi:hypothetical protein